MQDLSGILFTTACGSTVISIKISEGKGCTTWWSQVERIPKALQMITQACTRKFLGNYRKGLSHMPPKIFPPKLIG